MKCLVTGGAGFIGSHLVDRLLDENHEIIVLDNFDDYYSRKMLNLKLHIQNPNFKLIKGSVMNIKLMRKIMSDIDIVFHEAAQPGVRVSVKNPFKSYRVNTLGTLNLLIAAKDSDVKKIVNASSSSVYGKSDKLPISEDENLLPISPYGISKLAAEHYCAIFNELYGLKTVSLRYFTVYGERQRPDMAIRIFVDTLLRNKRPVIFGNGMQTRDLTYISDVIDANMLIMKKNSADGKILNIGSGRRVTINYLLKIILRVMGRKQIKPIYEESQTGDARHTWADISRAKELLGWMPKIKLEEGLKRFVDWYIQRR